MRRVINLEKVAEKFARDRIRFKIDLSLKGSGEKVVGEIKKILESGDNNKILHLRLFLDAVIMHSPSRLNLLRFRLGPELCEKLSEDNFKF